MLAKCTWHACNVQCNIYAPCMQHSRNARAAYTQHASNAYATYKQHTGNVHATYTQHPCSVQCDMHETPIQHTCNMHAISMQRPCNVHTAPMPFGRRSGSLSRSGSYGTYPAATMMAHSPCGYKAPQKLTATRHNHARISARAHARHGATLDSCTHVDACVDACTGRSHP